MWRQVGGSGNDNTAGMFWKGEDGRPAVGWRGQTGRQGEREIEITGGIIHGLGEFVRVQTNLCARFVRAGRAAEADVGYTAGRLRDSAGRPREVRPESAGTIRMRIADLENQSLRKT